MIGGALFSDIWWLDPNHFRIAANVVLVIVALLTTIFTVRYAFWSRWWTSEVGPPYLAMKTMWSLLLWQISLATWWDPDFPGRQELRFAIYSLSALAAVAMIAALVHQQTVRRRDKESSDNG
ncbi:hypothetical protein [Mycolicibacterium canariasense]|uniref:putative phage holin n=1 Tax=Mycolicibacterium canariasense TaxID=228230 RepID=UPI001041F18B|nr:hypothetical protein [Mycolicibacterium canariasense]MCV7208767.1 hypothetical protein [Mycolicibacterium canariasense]